MATVHQNITKKTKFSELSAGDFIYEIRKDGNRWYALKWVIRKDINPLDMCGNNYRIEVSDSNGKRPDDILLIGKSSFNKSKYSRGTHKSTLFAVRAEAVSSYTESIKAALKTSQEDAARWYSLYEQSQKEIERYESILKKIEEVE